VSPEWTDSNSRLTHYEFDAVAYLRRHDHAHVALGVEIGLEKQLRVLAALSHDSWLCTGVCGRHADIERDLGCDNGR
jgi:hypothetical protein